MPGWTELKPRSDERVWFADSRNCLNTDPGRAFEEMWRTAEDQAYLKMQAGVKRGGRVCEDPVKTLSLSWHKEDTPSAGAHDRERRCVPEAHGMGRTSGRARRTQ